MEKLNAVLNKKEDEEDKPELTRKEILKCIQSEHVRLRGVNLSGQDLSKLVGSFTIILSCMFGQCYINLLLMVH